MVSPRQNLRLHTFGSMRGTIFSIQAIGISSPNPLTQWFFIQSFRCIALDISYWVGHSSTPAYIPSKPLSLQWHPIALHPYARFTIALRTYLGDHDVGRRKNSVEMWCMLTIAQEDETFVNGCLTRRPRTAVNHRPRKEPYRTLRLQTGY